MILKSDIPFAIQTIKDGDIILVSRLVNFNDNEYRMDESYIVRHNEDAEVQGLHINLIPIEEFINTRIDQGYKLSIIGNVDVEHPISML